MRVLTVVTMLLVAVTMGLSLAHALESPGKLRLDEAAYRSVQRIYYPGFTVGGLVGEFGGMLVLAILLYLTPAGSSRFWWTLSALIFLVATHATYWLLTHPVNNFWVKDVAPAGPGATFFSIFAGRQPRGWTELRNTWEMSHVIRAALAMLSLASLSIAATLYETTARG